MENKKILSLEEFRSLLDSYNDDNLFEDDFLNDYLVEHISDTFSDLNIRVVIREDEQKNIYIEQILLSGDEEKLDCIKRAIDVFSPIYYAKLYNNELVIYQ